MWKQKPLAEPSLGEVHDLVSSVLLTTRSLEGTKPPCSTVLRRWTSAPSLQCLSKQKAELTKDTGQLHRSPHGHGQAWPLRRGTRLTGSTREVASLCPTAQGAQSQSREITVWEAKEQVQNLLSRSSDSQLLPKERSLARKDKTRNWA